MKIYGERESFCIEYSNCDNYEIGESILYVWIKGIEICSYQQNGEIKYYHWNLSNIVKWFKINLNHILNETTFPLPINANTSIEFFKASSNFDSNDDEKFYEWYKNRQDWYFRHAWCASNEGSFLADLFFRRVEDNIELQWDNKSLYDNINFINPVGLAYIDANFFTNVIHNFIGEYTY